MEYFKKNNNWIKYGIVWAILMYIFNNTINVDAKESHDIYYYLIQIPIWLLSGIAVGFFLKWIPDKE
jgi:hypothetical protein